MEYHGIVGSAGIVIGKVYHYERYTFDMAGASAGTPEKELIAYERAIAAAKTELEALNAHFHALGDEEKVAIFAAHLEILIDETMDEETRDAIQSGVSAAESIQAVYDNYISVFEGLEDPLIRERASDMRDVSSRLLRCLAGVPEQNLSVLPGPVIVVADDLVPSDTASLDRENVLGIITALGGVTSHSAIIARSYELPALLGVGDAVHQLAEGQEIILDAEAGVFFTEFTEADRIHYEKKREKFLERARKTKLFLDREPVTSDGQRILIEMNIASSEPQNLEKARYSDGVGLFRSEFLYLGHRTLPTEEEQLQTYRKVLMTFGKRPVILRTMDIGGDKQLDCLDLPKEDNPFLGNRALRLCFTHPDVFRTQLRAALRASVYGNLWIMFPMVGSMDDIRKAKSFVSEVQEELRSEGIAFREDVKIGIMIEIPSIAMLADIAAEEVDFASIGTNDLTQYCTAVDRGNPEIASYYQTFHPALFRLIGYVIREFSKRGKPVGVCGEMGGNPFSATVLIGLGMSQLSMNASSIADIKELVCSLSTDKAREIANTVCALSTADEVQTYLKNQIGSLIS